MQEDNTAIRQHVRHVTGLPIEIKLDYSPAGISTQEDDTITNVSLGGLSFNASDRIKIDEHIKIRFPVLKNEMELKGRVVWCEKSKQGYEVGLEFDDPKELERLKVIEQITHIEKYRDAVHSREGRSLNSEQAAKEWISQYTGNFSALQ
jgi:hypothetical protein